MINSMTAESLVPVYIYIYIDIFIKSGIQIYYKKPYLNKERIGFIKIGKKYIKDRLFKKIACPFCNLKSKEILQIITYKLKQKWVIDSS